MRSRAVSALQNAIACTKLTLSTGNVSPLKKLGLLPITDSNSRCVTSWVPIQKPRVRATSWLVPVTRVNWPGLSACIGIEGLNTTGLGTAGARGAWPESHPVQSTTHRTNRLLRHRAFISLRHGENTLFDPVRPLNSHDTGQWHNPRTCCGAYWISTPSSRMCCSCFSQNKMKLEGTGLRHGQFFSIR